MPRRKTPEPNYEMLLRLFGPTVMTAQEAVATAKSKKMDVTLGTLKRAVQLQHLIEVPVIRKAYPVHMALKLA